jgi:hypothetical protein
VVVVIELLLRHGTAASCALAILLAASPATVEFAVQDRRPDVLPISIFVASFVVGATLAMLHVAWLWVWARDAVRALWLSMRRRPEGIVLAGVVTLCSVALFCSASTGRAGGRRSSARG